MTLKRRCKARKLCIVYSFSDNCIAEINKNTGCLKTNVYTLWLDVGILLNKRHRALKLTLTDNVKQHCFQQYNSMLLLVCV